MIIFKSCRNCNDEETLIDEEPCASCLVECRSGLVKPSRFQFPGWSLKKEGNKNGT